MFVIGIYIGGKMSFFNAVNSAFFSVHQPKGDKLNDLLNYISESYVDSVKKEDITEKTINAMLENLDPHSSYIPAQNFSQVQESMEGNFDGIGIEFNLLNDTIVVVTPVAGGPSEALGIKPGDRIVKVEGKIVAGIKITNEEVLKKLRGKHGTKVNIGIVRRGIKKLLDFTITRDKIPLYSVDVAYMLTDNIGYIKLNKFAANTYSEFMEALTKLKNKGMTKLIFDLRGNPGGYLDAATKIADEFLEEGKMIVYTQGRMRAKEEFIASEKGDWEKNELVILVDEGSASASEIIAGAIQDNDRGTIIGRRSFGKGLVQEQSDFSDGSAIRLTIARYYTPTGRCIQKSYAKGHGEYYEEEIQRYTSGELINADSIKFDKKLQFKTPKGKIVYGGGGIMPDLFIPLDTAGRSGFLAEIVYRGILNDFALSYIDKQRAGLLAKYPDVKSFVNDFTVNEILMTELITYAKTQKLTVEKLPGKSAQLVIKNQLKAILARVLYKNEGFYRVLSSNDNAVKSAISSFSKTNL